MVTCPSWQIKIVLPIMYGRPGPLLGDCSLLHLPSEYASSRLPGSCDILPNYTGGTVGNQSCWLNQLLIFHQFKIPTSSFRAFWSSGGPRI
ncbi:hypothetical protein GQ55_8G113500 [Panicum hallii var. hallii]|uniref:Uncharacterized protein n=1 Tax=Panicum hallii var. hallii TaxID=1504633 RepID=A0A2T7CMM2_9POAL|nr:hypothetical protein GQ55_8G113500 [Panicum hallii var. hallii]